MTSWTVDAPTSLDLDDDVTALRVRLIAGDVAVIATDDRPSLIVSDITGRPLRVDHEDGTLTVSYDDERLSWERLLDWLKPTRDSASVTVTVPAHCPVQLGVVSASAVVCGVGAGASVKGVSGGITLDGITGDVDADTVSGALEGRDLDGSCRFKSVSGDLTLANGRLSLLSAHNISGQVTADVSLADGGAMQVSTVSGDVTLRLPAQCDPKVRLSSASGKVRNDFGNVGRGSGRVSVNTLSGSVTLLRRAPAEMESKAL